MHVFSEVYTGVNRANAFLYPDIISYQPKRNKWKLKNFTNQGAGQEFFNSASFIVKVNYTNTNQKPGNNGIYSPDMNFLISPAAGSVTLRFTAYAVQVVAMIVLAGVVARAAGLPMPWWRSLKERTRRT